MYEGLLHAHSGLRWILLIALVVAVIQAFGKEPNRKVALWAMILFHVQLLLGLVLYFFLSPRTKDFNIDMKDAVSRFYGVEHFSMMIIAAILITAGYSALKKSKLSRYKWLYLIGLVVLLAGIPWPFRIPVATWF